MTAQQIYDHNRYMSHRRERIAQQQEYYRDYVKKGLRKPRKKQQPRKEKDHERYLRERERILAQQREYRETHKEEIRERRRRRNFLRVYGTIITESNNDRREQPTTGIV